VDRIRRILVTCARARTVRAGSGRALGTKKMPRRTRGLLPLLLTLLLPWTALAVETTGQLKVIAVDVDDVALLGARVTVASPELMGTRSSTTNYKGEAWLPNLPPGVYSVRVELTGYKTLLVEQVRISIGGMTPVDVVLKPFVAAEETMEIVVARPTLDVESASTGETLDKEFLEDVPAGRSYQNTAHFTAGVTGGSNPNVMGGADNENAWLLDGVNISDPVTGTFSMNFNYDSIEEVQILTGLYKAEYGQALGGIINVVTDSGSNDFEMHTGVNYSNGNMSPRRDAVYQPDGEEIESSEYDTVEESLYVSSTVAGPIMRDRIWFHGSYQYTLTRRSTMGVEAPRRFEGHYVFAKLTASPHYDHTFTAQVSGNPANIDNTRQSNRVLPEAEGRQTQGNNIFSGKWAWYLGDWGVLNTQYTYMKEYLEITPVPCTHDRSQPGKYCEEDQAEGYIDLWTPGIYGRYDAYSRQNYYRYNYDDRPMHNASSELTVYLPDFLGSMEFKTGVNVRILGQDQISGYTGNTWINERLEDQGDPSSVINYYWVERPGALHSRGTGFELAAYLQDTWKPRANLTFDLGLRYERADIRNDVGRKIVNTQIFLPRLSFSWDPANNRRAKIYGGFGMFGDGGRISVSGFLDENTLGYKLYLGEYFDRNENHSYDMYSHDYGQSDYALWPEMAPPRSYEFTVGYDQIIWEQLMVGLSFTAKMFRNLWEDDEINLIWNDSGTATIGSQSGIYDDFFRLRTPTLARRDYYGVTLKVKQRLHRNFQVMGSLTYSSLKGITDDYLTIALDNPTQYPFEYGYLPADKPWVAKVAGSYRFPYRFTLGLTFGYFAGSRFDREYMSGHGGYDLYRTPRGSFDSLNGYSYLDLRVSKTIDMGQAGDVLLAVDFTNIFNARYATGISGSELNEEGEIEATSRMGAYAMEFQLQYNFD